MSVSLCHNRECVLCENSIFTDLPTAQCNRIRQLISKVVVEPKGILFREADPSTNMFVLRKGQVKLTTALPDGREQILRIAIPGHLLGFESVNYAAYHCTAQALTRVGACVIRQKDMLKTVAENPEICGHITRFLTDELHQAQQMIRDLGLKNAGERIASFLISMVQTKNGDLQDNVPLHVTRHEMAELLGLTTETVSRIISDLQRQNIIHAPRGSIRVLNPNRLKEKAEFSPPSTHTTSDPLQ